MTVEEQLRQLTGIVESLAGTVVAHDNQIDALINVAEKHQREMNEFREGMASLLQSMVETDRRWQAYLNTLPRH
jgi:hypothetical protein